MSRSNSHGSSPSLADTSGDEHMMERYGWRAIPAETTHLPIVLVDVDGTMRGDVLPMVRLARLLVPNYLKKITFREPLNAHKVSQFLINLGKLWTLRTVHKEQRRRYKHLFSELHTLAASLLRGTPVESIRRLYRERLQETEGLWHDGAVELLQRITAGANVILVTGSEQLQTEECVRLLCERGVAIERLFVRGSLYAVDPASERFTGTVAQLNVTLDGKRDVLQSLMELDDGRVLAAAGNSRPDRAMFDVVKPGGLCALVCPKSVRRDRNQRTFVIRKLRRSGYELFWDVPDYLSAVELHARAGGNERRPILATDSYFAELLQNDQLRDLYPSILS